MYNSLILIALVPLIGPGAVDQVDLNQSKTNIVTNNQYVRSANEISVLPIPLSTSVKESETPVKVVSANKIDSDVSSDTVQPVTASQVTNNELIVGGWLEVPKRNHIILAAPCSAVLMSLRTMQDNNETIITEGIHVKKGQFLGKFDDRTLQNQLRIDEAQLNVAIAAEEKIIEIEYAARTVQVAITKVNILKETNKKHAGTIPAIEILLAEHERLQAEANLELCKYGIEHERKEETNVRRQTIEATKTNIQIRQLISPIDGVVTKIERAEGEYVREGEPVIEITQLDTLRAVFKVNLTDCSPSQLDGKNVTVQVKKTKEGNEIFDGKIVFIDPKVNINTNEYDIYIEIKNQESGNRWKLQPGSRVTAKIKL
ncbi:MAG: HlyD family efflux transporter periplasmic adaptor subunit [Planctomycetaceae bacterium]|nr:HlyD family efflux transporter periplasmic adaptor subunit [Planctomycetaceae bacterium]